MEDPIFLLLATTISQWKTNSKDILYFMLPIKREKKILPILYFFLWFLFSVSSFS